MHLRWGARALVESVPRSVSARTRLARGVYYVLAKGVAMRILTLALSIIALMGCFNTHHPEYHPVTQVRYQQHIASPIGVHGTAGQPVYVMPSPQQTTEFPGAPPPPQPPPDFPW